MFAIPFLPAWDALHPAISHFPVVLLLVAPLCLLLALFSPANRRALLVIALALLAAGTIGAYLSAATGDAARDSATRSPELAKAIEEHEEIGSVVRAASTGLTLLLAGLLYGPRLLKRTLPEAVVPRLVAALLALSVVASLAVYNAARSGGVLVHRLGIHAKL